MKFKIIILLSLLFIGGVHATNFNDFTQHAQLKYAVVSNFEPNGKFKAVVEIRNLSDVSLSAGKGEWQLYMHSSRRIVSVDSTQVSLERIQGDLYRIRPSADFVGIKPNDTWQFEYVGLGDIASYSYFMPRAFMVDPAGKSYVFANTNSEDVTDYVYPFETPQQYLRFNSPSPDYYALSANDPAFSEKYQVTKLSKEPGILPTPSSVKLSDKKVSISGAWSIQFAGGLQFEADYLREQFAAKSISLGINTEATANRIRLLFDDSFEPAAYSLDIQAQQILLKANSSTGIFYGIQSLIKLAKDLPEQQLAQLPIGQISDAPRFAWRGMHYDIARNFHGKGAILALIEQMGRYKLNKLHLHLTDDEGWRLQIPGLEELTEVGGTRCFDLSEQRCLLTQLGNGPFEDQSGSGYLSTDDYAEILRFAAQRHVEVIPEIDMPGHARAAIVAMKARYHKLLAKGQKQQAEEYLLSDLDDKSQYLTVQSYSDNSINACMPSTYQFIQKVTYEIQKMHRQAGAPLKVLHIGGDEVGKGSWQSSPACASLFAEGHADVVGVDDIKPYFVRKVADIANQRGLAIAGWEDGLMYDRNVPFARASIVNPRVIANAWDNIWESGVSDRAYILANAGFEVVISAATHLYFDHPQEVSPNERGYHWATRYSDLNKVFSFMPDNLYANAKKTLSGKAIEDLDKLVNKRHVSLKKPENIIGMQGQLWSETVRNRQQMEQMIYPRIVALAERAWHKADWEGQPQASESALFQQDWQHFLNLVVHQVLPDFDKQGIAFYVPPPRLKRLVNSVVATNLLPGLLTEYSRDNGLSWIAGSNAPFDPKKPVIFRSRLGHSTSTNVLLTDK